MNVDFIKYKYKDSFDGVITKKRFKIGMRHLQMLYMFLCTTTFGFLRGSNTLAILALTDQTRNNDTYIQIHDWDNRIQGIILSAYFFGYSLMLAPAEVLLKNVNGKVTLTTALFIDGSLRVAMPTVIKKGGWIALCNSYFLLGILQTCLSPAQQILLSKWLPPNEAGLFSGLIYGGIQLGISIGLPVSGLLTQTRLGWELIFYCQGILTLSMAVIWGLLTSSSPDSHQAVGDAEKEYIAESLSCYRQREVVKPWRQIMASRQFWAVACAHAASNAVFIFFLTGVPIYLKTLGIPLKDCALISTLPLLAMWITHHMTAPWVDWIYRFTYVHYIKYVTCYRKLLNGMGTLGTVIGLTILSSLGHDSTHLTITLLIATLGMLGFQYSGYLESHRDMTNNFSGTLLLMTTSVASVIGAFVPLATGFILDGVGTTHSWKIIFISMASFYILCNSVYTALGSSEVQFWDNPRRSKHGYHNELLDTNQVELDELTHSKLATGKLELDTTI